MYALIEFAGKQFKIEEGSSIRVPYIKGKVGSKINFDKILYMDDGKEKTVGNPLVKGVTIDGEITSHGRGRKVVVFKFKRRKGYQKKNTNRQDYSILKVGKLGKVKKVSNKKVTTKTTETKATPKKAAAQKKASIKTTAKKVAPKKTAVKKTTTSKASDKPKKTKD